MTAKYLQKIAKASFSRSSRSRPSLLILIIISQQLIDFCSAEIRCGDSTTSGGRDGFRPSSPRIFGGRNARPGEVPFQVKLRMDRANEQVGCGGVIIGPRSILTAAHCMIIDKRKCKNGITVQHRPREIAVWIGNGEPVSVDKITVHPQFCPNKHSGLQTHDIAIIKTRETMKWRLNSRGGSVNRICLPSRGQDYRVGQPAIASGWGKTETGAMSNSLRLVILELLSQCQINDGGRICTNTLRGRGICYGDSGGPVFRYRESTGQAELVGIASFVVSDKCVDPLDWSESVYTRISNFIDWINANDY